MRRSLEDAGAQWLSTPKGRRRMSALKALCDTYIPAVRPPAGAEPMGGYWIRRASDLSTELAVAGWIETRLPTVDRDGLVQLLDLLAVTGFARLPQPSRARLINAAPRTSEIARGFRGLREMTMGMFYSLPLASGGNPNWSVIGYPGPPPLSPPTGVPRITPYRPESDSVTLDADVCIVGSGSGGSVIAAVLAHAGLEVVVLEAGGHYEEHNYPADEPQAYDELYWRGGFKASDDGNLLLAAGATLGGGSVVNWSNCVQPPERLRREWAEHGLKDVDTAAFDGHLSAVNERLSVNADCSQRNGPNERLMEGAQRLDWSWRCADRNSDPATYEHVTSGFIGFGDRSGSKQSAVATFLADAAARQATILVDTHVRRILTASGRAAGVEGVMTLDGRKVAVRVRAATVVVAGGALETPAVLLRSGLGGPAAGQNLHLHPTFGLTAFYDEPQDPWEGAPHTVIVDEFAAMDEGYGFLIEGIPFGPGFTAAGLSPYGGRAHKVMMSRVRHGATMISVVRDRGSGRVTLSGDGDAFVEYPFDDDLDAAHLRAAFAAMSRAHEAAGARTLFDHTIGQRVMWRRGEPLQPFLEAGSKIPFRLPHRLLATAHQMGSARMGTDPRTSVADPEGQLHDTAGVWIGDTSAFPSAAGVNPMITCMALAHRTASAILSQVG
jgi:glycine/D-amino acid oxidase-like deaminating enzyme